MAVSAAPRVVAVPRKWPPAVRAAADALREALALQGFRPPLDFEAAAFACARVYVRESKPKRLEGASAVARALAGMAVGDRLEFPAVARPSVYGRMKTARALMKNDNALWFAEVKANRLHVERREDGPRGNRITCPLAHKLAAMEVDTTISHEMAPERSRVFSITLVAEKARRLMNDPSPRWSTMRTTKGARITRTA